MGANTGFRAPNLNELYWPNDGGFVGEPGPEAGNPRATSRPGLRYQDDDSELGVTYYHNKVKNLILNEPTADNPFCSRPSMFRTRCWKAYSDGMKKFGGTRLRASSGLERPAQYG